METFKNMTLFIKTFNFILDKKSKITIAIWTSLAIFEKCQNMSLIICIFVTRKIKIVNLANIVNFECQNVSNYLQRRESKITIENFTNLVVSEECVPDFFVGGHSNSGVDGVTVQGRKHSSPQQQKTLKFNFFIE